MQFLLQDNTQQDAKLEGVQYCEVYQLGKQTWDANQSYLKQAVYRVSVNTDVLRLYDEASQLFRAQIRQTDKGEVWLAISKILPWICDNLIVEKPWYSGFFEFRKSNAIYERKGLIRMNKYLHEDEQVLFDAVQGAFSAFLRGQFLQAQKQERKLDYGQVTDKVIYRMQRPSTQQEFASVLVDFLSQFRSKAMRSVGPQLYQWIHRENNWRRARDLVLLAIATYTSKKDDALEGRAAPIESSESTEEEFFELSVN